MAFEADCGASTVLEASYVTRTAGPHVEEALRGPRDEALRNTATPTGNSERAAGALVGRLACRAGGRAGDGCRGGGLTFRIQNSEFSPRSPRGDSVVLFEATGARSVRLRGVESPWLVSPRVFRALRERPGASPTGVRSARSPGA